MESLDVLPVAKEVFVLLNRDFRISRNIRLKWYFDHLNSQLIIPDKSKNSSGLSDESGLQVISAVPLIPTHGINDSLFLNTNTKITFLAEGYRFVFGLDLSASLLRADTFQHFIMIESVLLNLERCLASLLESYTMPGPDGDFVIKPDIYVTIFAQWHGTRCNDTFKHDIQRVVQKVIVQGCLLSENEIARILQCVKENIYNTVRVDEPGRHKSALQKRDDILIGILRTGLLALRLLPSHTSSAVIIITDGVLGEPNPTSLERLLRQCQNTTTSCSFVHVNPSAFSLCDFGCISNVELMQFIAQSTKGKYINSFSVPSKCVSNMNIYQQALFPWTFQVQHQLPIEKIPLQDYNDSCSAIELRNICTITTEPPAILTRKQDERTLRAHLLTVVSSRLREGYEVKNIRIVKNIIEVVLILQWWKNSTSVEYRVSSSWPLLKNTTKVEVYISGTYEFLLDVSKRDEAKHWTRPRKLVLHRFLRFFQDLMHSDHMLTYLRSFAMEPVRYTISDMLKQGQTLYYMPPNSSIPELSSQAQHSSASFSSYWKPILSLDVNIWQQWMHIHRIELILHHDTPLPKHLHILAPTGRYHSVQCRVAFSQLISMLRDWCTFVLLEYHTYVKFVYDDNSDKPYSFFLVRVSSKSPALVLKLAFLIGLSGKVRKIQVDDLKDRILALTIPSATTGSSTKRVRHTSSRLSPNVKPSRTFHSASDKPCVALMHKPLDQVLVRYAQTPENYKSNVGLTEPPARANSEVNEHYIRMRDMQWYLQRKRYVWSLTNKTSTPLSIDVASHLASLLMKVRMQENYHIAYTSSGIVNMTREFSMFPSPNVGAETKNSSDYCLIQFILFPPKFQTAHTSVSAGESEEEEDDDDIDLPSIQKEIVFAAEIWVEPQDGYIPMSANLFDLQSPGGVNPQLSTSQCNVPYYEGLSCNDIAKAIIDHDSICISNIVTLEHLQLMCSSDTISATLPQKVRLGCFNSSVPSPQEGTSPSNDTILSDGSNNITTTYKKQENLNESTFEQVSLEASCSNIQYFPCVFDLGGLLDESPRVQHLFMTLAGNILDTNCPNFILLSAFHKSLELYCDCVVSLSEDDQSSITQHMIKRKGLKDRFIGQDAQPGSYSQGFWSCYLKQGENGQVFVILLPCTFEDYLKLCNVLSDAAVANENDSHGNFTGTTNDEENKKQSTDVKQNSADLDINHNAPLSPHSQIPSEVEAGNNYRLNRRISIKRLASMSSENADNMPAHENNFDVSKRTFPVFVYNCSMKMLVTSMLNSAKSPQRTRWPDMLQDHRYHVVEEYSQAYERFSPPAEDPPESPKPLTPGVTDINDEVFPLTSTENDHLQKLCRSVVSLYHRSFVLGIFSAVQQDDRSNISIDDLQIATDCICQESVDEIDITDFVLLNCPQVAEFRSQNFQLNLLSDFEQHSSDIFNSDDPDIESIGLESSTEQIFISKQQKESVSANSTKKEINPHDNQATAKSTVADVGLSAEDQAIQLDIESIMSINQQNGSFSTKKRLQKSDIQQSTPPPVTIPLHHKSAFTTVQRHSSSRVSECGNDMLENSSSSEDEVQEATSKRRSKPKRERKITTTLPVKRVNARKFNSVCFQTGWNNLPDFPVAELNTPHLRHLSGSNEQVVKHFLSLLKNYCRPVSFVPDLYYAVKQSDTHNINVSHVANHQTESDLEDVQFISDRDLPKKKEVTLEESLQDLNESTSDNVAFRLTMPSFIDDDVYSTVSDTEGEINPLFLCMTCSIHDKKTGNHGTLPVKCLPVNLKDILSCLEKPCDYIDLSQLKITLDLIWIFLPQSNRDGKLGDFPSDCLPHVNGTKTSIKWLLEDEIISSLRTSEPISTSTLNRVADHVTKSKTSNCLMSTVPLQFIFGIDKSKSLFCTEFESLRMENYKLKKEDNFYYLSLERSFMPIPDYLLFKENSMPAKDGAIKESDERPVAFDLTESPSPNGSKPSNILSLKNRASEKMETSHIFDLSSCLSLQAIEADNTIEIGKADAKIKKASSTIELSTSSFPSRRCTSVSGVPYNEGTLKERHSFSRPSPLQIKRPLSSNVAGTPSPGVRHQTLRVSLSCGKDTKASAISVPVTPNQDFSHTFSFPTGLTKSEFKPSSCFSREQIFSPSSECSPRHYSQTSWLGGSGYEGEESDVEDEVDYRESLQEAYSQLPNFWLVLCIKNDGATVYFHRRTSARVLKAVKVAHARIFSMVCKNLKNACVAVNQTLLLRKLHDSQFCHSLLVEESAENVWKRDDYSSVYKQTPFIDEQAPDDTSGVHVSEYLAANMNFPPGHFECQVVLQQYIVLHHRLTASTTTTGSGIAPTALTTVRSFMKNFAVINQKNMFVYQVQDGTVYYCKMHEEGKKPESQHRRSSLFQTDINAAALSSPTTREVRDLTFQVDNEPKLHLRWFGVHCLTDVHKKELNDLKDGIERKLDDAVLECITVMLSRNSMFKLTPADVRLIQPRRFSSSGTVIPLPPDNTISFALPPGIAGEKSVPSLLYYIHQNLLQFLAVPRYTEPNTEHFLPYFQNSETNSEKNTTAASVPSSLYLFNGLTEKGRKGHGIACICLDFPNKQGTPSVKLLNAKENFTMQTFRKLSTVLVSDSIEKVDHEQKQPVVHFHAWICGSLKTDDLYEKIQMAVQHALCDSLLEHMLRFPFTPVKQIKTDAMRSLFSSSEKPDETPFLHQFLQSKFGKSSDSGPKLHKDAAKDENLQKGDILDSLYHEFLLEWLNYMQSISSPSVTCSTFDFKSRLSLEQGMINLTKILGVVLTDSKLLMFSKVQNEHSNWEYMDNTDAHPTSPGNYHQWIVVSRNFYLWKKVNGTFSNLKPNQVTSSLQKFAPHDATVKPETSPCPQHDLIMSSSYISRQHLLYLTSCGKSVKVYMYNISCEKSSGILYQFRQCIKFHNARHNMLQGLTFQKLGLFKHFVTKRANGDSEHLGRDTSLGSYSVDLLTKHTRMPLHDKKKQRFTPADQYFDDILLDNPYVPISSGEKAVKDKCSQFGQQCHSAMKHKLVLKEVRMHLKNMWRRTSANTTNISSTTLNVILSNARLIHADSSPILLDFATRHETMKLFLQDKYLMQKCDSSRSHVVLSRTSSFLGSYRRKSGDSLSKLSEKETSDSTDASTEICKNSLEFMADKFAELYAEHWRGFIKLQVQSPVHYLYRPMPGGIVLISHAYLQNRFEVKIYAIDISPISEQSSPNTQMSHATFISECEKMKDKMDVHMFSLEMHIRCVQWYLTGMHSVIKSGYNLPDLLLGLKVCYSSLNDDISTQLFHDVLHVPCNPVTSQDLFGFIVDNADIFNLQSCLVKKGSRPETCEYVLYFVGKVEKQHLPDCSIVDHEDLNVCVVIMKTENLDKTETALKLSYYILFSHKRVPRLIEERKKKLPSVITNAKASLSRRFSEVVDVNSARAASLMHLNNPLPEANQHSPEHKAQNDAKLRSFVNCEKAKVENLLTKISSTAKIECYRRYYLWNKLVHVCQDKGSGKMFSVVDFNKLADLMQIIPASEFDLNISKLFWKHNQVKYGHNLQKRLLKLFPKSSTMFVSSDLNVQHICILSLRDVHVMVNMQVDSIKKDLTVFILMPLPEHHVFHKGDINSAAKDLYQEVTNVICTTVWQSWLT